MWITSRCRQPTRIDYFLTGLLELATEPERDQLSACFPERDATRAGGTTQHAPPRREPARRAKKARSEIAATPTAPTYSRAVRRPFSFQMSFCLRAGGPGLTSSVELCAASWPSSGGV